MYVIVRVSMEDDVRILTDCKEPRSIGLLHPCTHYLRVGELYLLFFRTES